MAFHFFKWLMSKSIAHSLQLAGMQLFELLLLIENFSFDNTYCCLILYTAMIFCC